MRCAGSDEADRSAGFPGSPVIIPHFMWLPGRCDGEQQETKEEEA